MGQSKWTEEKIIQTLREFPEWEDQRSKEELFGQIQKKVDQQPKKRSRFRLMPVLAAACIFAIALIISPALLNEVFQTPSDTNTGDQEIVQPFSMKAPAEKPVPEPEKVEPADPPAPPPEEIPETTEIVPFAYIDEEYTYHSGITEVPEDKQVVTAYYPDEEAMGVIPVSYLARKDMSRIDALNEALNKIQPTELGLSHSDLKKVKLEEDSETNSLVVDIKPGTLQGSTGERMFVDAVNGTAYSLGFDTIQFKTAGEKGYEFSHLGPMETMNVEAPHKGISSWHSDTGALFLAEGAPLTENNPATLKESLQWMGMMSEGFQYEKIIPDNVYFSGVDEEGSKIRIEFAEGTHLEDSPRYVAMIDSILWTANKYGYEQVELKNAPIEQIGPYQLSKTLPVLKAPNVIQNQ